MTDFQNWRPARLVKGVRWYIEYYQTDPVSGVMIRSREYLQMNRITDKRERLRFALNHISNLNNNLLPYGYPYKDSKNKQIIISIGEAVKIAMQIKSRSDRAKTVSSYKSVVDNFMKYIQKNNRQDAPLRDFGHTDAVMYLDYVLTEKSVGARTYNNYKQFMTAIWNELIERGYCAQNPWSKIKKLKVTEKNRKMLDDRDAQQILDAAMREDKQLLLAILLLYYCAIRPGEQRQMKAGYIDLENGVVTLPGSITKNKKSEHVTIPTEIIPVLRKLGVDKMHRNDFIFGKGFLPHPDEMCGANTMAERHKTIVNKLYEQGKIRTKTGTSIYSWKDTGAMSLIKSGVDPYEIMRHFRHSDLNTTQKYMQSLHSRSEAIRNFRGSLLPQAHHLHDHESQIGSGQSPDLQDIRPTR